MTMDKTGYIDKTGTITDGYDGFIDVIGGFIDGVGGG